MRLSSLLRLLVLVVLVVLGARAVAEPLDGESLYRHVERPQLATTRGAAVLATILIAAFALEWLTTVGA